MRRHKTAKPMRRCIACRESKPQDDLIRFVLCDGMPAVDTDGRAEGRGFYLCRSKECAETAIRRKAFNRACRRNVEEIIVRELIEQVLDNDRGGMNAKES